jgi:hypothetical protein
MDQSRREYDSVIGFMLLRLAKSTGGLKNLTKFLLCHLVKHRDNLFGAVREMNDCKQQLFISPILY